MKNAIPLEQPSCRGPLFREGQTAIEYLVLLGVITVIVLIAFRDMLPVIRLDAQAVVNQTARGIYGEFPNADYTFNEYP